MKKITFAFIAVLAVAALAFTNAFESYTVDTSASVINWVGTKVTGTHNGTVMLKSGKLDFEGGKLTGGNFVIDMTTIKNIDLGERAGRLEGHLKSEDFFGTEKYPTAKFVITRASEAKPGEYRIKGDLTIKSTTKPIAFTAYVTEAGNKMTAKADIVVDRSEFDVRYGSGSFFEDLGDKTIYDEFDLAVSLVVSK